MTAGTPERDDVVVAERPDARHAAARTSSRRSRSTQPRQRPDRARRRPAGPAAGERVDRSCRSARSTSRPDDGRGDGPRRPRPDRGHGALRRGRADRGRRAARCVAPRRGGLGRDERRRRRAGGPAGARARAPRRGPAPPDLPGDEVDRLRDERLNDLLQAQADPRRRADETFIGTIYAPASPYHRPSGGHPGDRRGARRRGGPRAAYERDPRPGPRDARGRRRRRRAGRRRRSPSACSATGRGMPSAVEPTGPIDDTRRRARPPGPGRPSAGQRPDRDPHRSPRAAAAHPGLPRRVGDGRDPRRAVQLPAEHAAARGEGLHLRRRGRVSTCAGAPGRSPPGPPSTPRSPSRRSSTRSPSSNGCATRAVDRRRARCGARLPRRRVPAAVRDARRGRRGGGRASRCTACRSTS